MCLLQIADLEYDCHHYIALCFPIDRVSLFNYMWVFIREYHFRDLAYTDIPISWHCGQSKHRILTHILKWFNRAKRTFELPI